MSPGAFEGDDGFSLTELMVSLMIFTLVLASLLGILTSFTSGERRNEAQGANQAAVRLAVVQLERDVQEASSVGVLTSTADYATTLVLSTATGCVRWAAVDDGLVRTAEEPCDTVVTRRVVLDEADATFTYHRPDGTAIAATETPWDYASCTARVTVELSGAVDDRAPAFDAQADVGFRTDRRAGC